VADEKTIYVTFEFQGNLDKDVDGVTNSLDRLEIEASKVLKKMAEGSNLVSRGFRVQADAINKLPGPLNTAASGVGSLSKAFGALKASGIVFLLDAIVVALRSLVMWFNSSVEGQMEFARTSGYLSGVMGQLRESLIRLGETIYRALRDPIKAVNDVCGAILNSLSVRLLGLGEMFQALGKIISSGFTDGFNDLTEGWSKVY